MSRSSASAAIQPDISTIGMPGSGMRRAAGEVQAAQVGAAVARLERPEPLAVTREPVDRAVEHAVAVVDVLRRQAASKTMRDSMSGIWPVRLELFQDDAAVLGQHPFPVVMRTQIRRVDEHVERFAARRARCRARCEGVAAR